LKYPTSSTGQKTRFRIEKLLKSSVSIGIGVDGISIGNESPML
jgi:hypothetical protein